MATVETICDFLNAFAPLSLAESWDNVGLLVGRQDRPVSKIMTCLTITPNSAEEAAERQADMIVTHHPMPFRSLNRLTDETTTGKILLRLIESRTAIYSPHTSFDSAARGINQRLAEGLELTDVVPLDASEDDESVGAGRVGHWEGWTTLAQTASRLKDFLKLKQIRAVGLDDHPVRTVGAACGSGGSFLSQAHKCECDLMVTGEATFHTCLEAEALGVALLLVGHYASERFAVEGLADELSTEFSDVEVWASEREKDPLRAL